MLLRKRSLLLNAKKRRLTRNAFCPTGEGGGVDPTCSPNGGGNSNVAAQIASGHKDKFGMERSKAIRDDIAEEAKRLGYDVMISDSKSTNSVYLIIGNPTQSGGISTKVQVRISDHATAFKRTGKVGNHVNMRAGRIKPEQIQKVFDQLPKQARVGETVVLREMTTNAVAKKRTGSTLLKRDPTRTLALRKRFSADMTRRFNKLKVALIDLIVKEDAFGLLEKSQPHRVLNVFCPTGEGGGVDPSCSPSTGGIPDSRYTDDGDIISPDGLYVVKLTSTSVRLDSDGEPIDPFKDGKTPPDAIPIAQYDPELAPASPKQQTKRDEPKPKKLSNKELQALDTYTGEDYSRIRDCLSKKVGCAGQTKETIKNLNSALKNSPKFEGTTYRGVKFFSERERAEFVASIQKQGVLKDAGFLSTSRDPEIAKGFAMGSNRVGVMLEIKGRSGVDITKWSDAPEEKEVLFAPKSKLKFTGMRKTKGMIYVTLEEH